MAADAAGCTGRSEEHDGIAHQLVVVEDVRTLLLGQLGLGGVEGDPVKETIGIDMECVEERGKRTS